MYEKMWNCKKNRNSYICNDIKKLLCICNVKKNVMRTGLFIGHFANGCYAISIVPTLHWYKKNVFKALEIAEGPFGKFQAKNESKIFDQIISVVLRWAKPKNHRAKIFHKKYRWFCGERHHKTTEPKFPIKRIGGFTVSDTEKPPQCKKKYRWLFGDFDWQLT